MKRPRQPPDPQAWTAFQARVYALVRQVPPGRVITYGAIATALGDPRKAREVGWALYELPDGHNVPAHRVVNREGCLTGAWAFNHPDRQRTLLEAEGIAFLSDGRVDLARHLWTPPDGQ